MKEKLDNEGILNLDVQTGSGHILRTVFGSGFDQIVSSLYRNVKTSWTHSMLIVSLLFGYNIRGE